MDGFVQRMVQRVQDQVFQKMSLEKRGRKLAIMKALAQNNFKVQNKENKDPLNNNLALPNNFTHSTPLKNQQITEVEMEKSEASDNNLEFATEKRDCSATEPELVVTKIYDLEPSFTETFIQDREDSSETEDFEIEVTPTKMMKGNELNVLSNEHKQWKSLECFDETAEYEFCKSLEQSKLYLSTSNLLEEIEADLPSPYSLARPLNHTFHTLTSYRTMVRLKRVDTNLAFHENSNFEFINKSQISPKKFSYLEMEATVQKSIAEQAEKALILSKSQKSKETEHLEKTLLLADLRFNAALQEMERLRLLGDYNEENFGQITISDMIFKVEKIKLNDFFICTATNKENVQCVSVVSELCAGILHFQEPIKFQNLSKDFIISLVLYKKDLKEGKKQVKTSIMKKLKELAMINENKNLTNNRGSNHGFICLARAELRLKQTRHCRNNICSLHFLEPPQYPIIGSTVNLVVQTDVNLVDFKHSGFLNVFKHTWHRRWFFQSGHFLESWLYPEDQENSKSPIDSMYLTDSYGSVEIADSEFCVRPHSFLLILGSINEKILFSADSQKDMHKWMDHLNTIFSQVKLWKQNN